jgi:hypothetical protein
MTGRPAPVSEHKEPMPRSSSVSKSEPSGVSMDVLSLLRLLGRHWRVTAPAALLTVLGLVAALQFSSPNYEATGSVLLLSPPEPPDVNDLPVGTPAPVVGPFARYGDLAVVSDVLARFMDSDSKRAEFESQGVTGYDVAANRLERGPVVDVTGQGPNPDVAIQSTKIVLKEVEAVLLELQQDEGADPAYFVTSTPLEPPSTATAMYGSTVRVAIGALAVGTVCMFGLAVLAEAFARRRTNRPTAVARPVLSDPASLGTEPAASNGSRKGGWSGILPALRSAPGKPSQQEPGQQEPGQQEPGQQEPSEQESAQRKPEAQEPSEQEPSEQEPSAQEPAQRKPEAQEPSEQESARRKPSQRWQAQAGSGPQNQAKYESARRKPMPPESAPQGAARRKPSKQELAWERSFQLEPLTQESAAQKPFSEFPADNGHRRPTTDRSP